MPSNFFASNPLTRVERCREMESILWFISKIRRKERELFKAAKQNGIHSKDAKKHKVIKKFLEEINQIISDFNQKRDSAITLADKTVLLEKISTLVSNFLSQHRESLALMRNPAREQARSMVYGGTFLGSMSLFASSYLSLTTLGSLILIAAVSPRLSHKVIELVGLNDISSDSSRLFCELSLAVSITLDKLPKIESTTDDENADLEGPAELMCPIKVGLMKDPVLCTLDGHTYERKFIEKWLRLDKSSPMNRNVLPGEKNIKDVLFENRAIKSLIDRYIQNPEQLAAEFKLSK